MSTATIIVVGLGPGRLEDLTVAAHEALEQAPRVVCRTTRHPTVDALRARRPALQIDSFDTLYDGAQSFDALYTNIAERLVAQAVELAANLPASDEVGTSAQAALLYAVPGHPLIGEESVRRLRPLAAEQGVEVSIIPGLSFIEPVCEAIGLDPLARHLQLLDATLLAALEPSAVMGAVLPTEPVLVAQLYNRRLASGVKLALSEVYPDDWKVTVVRWAGLGAEETVEHVPLYELDRGERADHLTTLYLPPLPPLDAVRVPEGFRYIVERLRAPDGCPWDREQTHQSLRTYVLEEAYEVAEVLDEWDDSPEVAAHLAEELGDLLLQVYLQAEVARGEGHFHIGDVYTAIAQKLIRRHPHVFGDVQVRDAAHVLQNWEVLKRAERVSQGQDVTVESRLRGIPRSAPALYQAHELSRKAARAGFDWPDASGAVAKVAEEVVELAEANVAGDQERISDEMGDLLFALASLARRMGVQPEEALRAANNRFRHRFEAMEAHAQRECRDLATLTLDEWVGWWNDAKAETASDSLAEGA